jgi:hypothetical protein
MLKRTFRVYALSLAGGALLLGGATVAAGAMTLPGSLPGGVAEQATAAIVTDGAGAAKVEQVYWRGRGWGWRGTGTVMLAAVGNTARRSPRTRNAS